MKSLRQHHATTPKHTPCRASGEGRTESGSGSFRRERCCYRTVTCESFPSGCGLMSPMPGNQIWVDGLRRSCQVNQLMLRSVTAGSSAVLHVPVTQGAFENPAAQDKAQINSLRIFRMRPGFLVCKAPQVNAIESQI